MTTLVEPELAQGLPEVKLIVELQVELELQEMYQRLKVHPWIAAMGLLQIQVVRPSAAPGPLAKVAVHLLELVLLVVPLEAQAVLAPVVGLPQLLPE